MPTRILVAYATMYGSTREVAEAIAAELRAAGAEVDALPVREVRDLERYDGVILGAPLLVQRLHKDARTFLSRFGGKLGERPIALYALGPVHDDPAEWEGGRAQFYAELSKTPSLHPIATELFGGRFDPSLLRFPFNKFAGPAGASDARDWDAIRAWARELYPRLRP